MVKNSNLTPGSHVREEARFTWTGLPEGQYRVFMPRESYFPYNPATGRLEVGPQMILPGQVDVVLRDGVGTLPNLTTLLPLVDPIAALPVFVNVRSPGAPVNGGIEIELSVNGEGIFAFDHLDLINENAQYVESVSAIAANTPVIVVGQNGLKDQARVKVVNAAAGAAPPQG